eukprot:365636-Chlamydomonas_euryale.AAC.2
MAALKTAREAEVAHKQTLLDEFGQDAQLPDLWVEAGLSAGAQRHGGGPGSWQPQPAHRGLEATFMPASSDGFEFAVPAMGAATLPPPLPPESRYLALTMDLHSATRLQPT